MTRHDEFDATTADFYNTVENSPEPCKPSEELLYSKDSLGAFKTNQAWPGRNYSLVGEAHVIERRTIDTISATRRAACINNVLQLGRNNQHCVTIEDALTVAGFVSCLSRVEYAWLKKQSQGTLIGPSYCQEGNLIAESFAVWRRDDVCKSAGRTHNSFRNFRGSRSTVATRHES
ncbi:MAG: hypothetical protein SGJ27_23520 [Candidatus Melainabacteria bacterium]|nr:hypothetical protein [Candidatus Melainabacteria bacterium]